jgi:vancomycin resistance protein YoaR
MSQPTERRRRPWLLLCLGVVALIPLATLGMAVTDNHFARAARIAHNVRIAGVPVGGETRPEALDAVMREWVADLPQQIRLHSGKGRDAWLLTPAELGSRLLLGEAIAEAFAIGRTGNVLERSLDRLRLWRSPRDVRVECAVDEDTLREALVELAGQVNREPRNADVAVADGDVQVVPEVWGRKLSIDESLAALAEALRDPTTKSVELAVEQQEPGVKATQLRKLEVVLGSFTTRFSLAKKSRCHNLQLAVRALNKALIMPGEVFSLNERLGPRQPEFGYREAGTFIRGELVPSAGGGVCQVSSALYNAALLANLKVVGRQHHSMPVEYISIGLDATVFYGVIDLKIRNNLKNPVLVLAHIEGNKLTVSCLGAAEDDYDVEIERSNIRRIAHERREIETDELPEGEEEVEKEGRDGYRVTVTRIVRREGQELERQVLHRDVYAPRTEVVRIGTGTGPAEGSDKPDAAASAARGSDE